MSISTSSGKLLGDQDEREARSQAGESSRGLQRPLKKFQLWKCFSSGFASKPGDIQASRRRHVYLHKGSANWQDTSESKGHILDQVPECISQMQFAGQRLPAHLSEPRTGHTLSRQGTAWLQEARPLEGGPRRPPCTWGPVVPAAGDAPGGRGQWTLPVGTHVPGSGRRASRAGSQPGLELRRAA